MPLVVNFNCTFGLLNKECILNEKVNIILKENFTCLLNERATAIFSHLMEIFTVYLIFKIYIKSIY